jgi:hypothetical protein
MRINLFIFALSLSLIQGVTSTGFCQSHRMTFSDALPVQFWLTGCETFNEYEAEGVHHVCWCQPWNCTDEITTQFKDTTGQTLKLVAYDSEDNELFSENFIEIATGVYQLSFIPDDEDICDELIKLEVQNSSDVMLAKSDCLDIKTSHIETTLFTYSNHRNYDGLVYEDQSPDVEFNIRVPSRFFHEDEPEEDEAIELTSSVITTSSQVKTQRLLEVKHAPYYFHKKLRRILKHQSIEAIGKGWKKEEKYQINEGTKTWPLKSATCLLTEDNSVIRNVL